MSKRFLTLLTLLLVATMVLVACGGNNAADNNAADNNAADNNAADNAADNNAADDTEEDMSLYDGMTAEELAAAGWVVVAPGDNVRIEIGRAHV